MTEAPDQNEDELRRHPEQPAEGADPDDTSDDDDVREHPEGPSEG